MQIGLKLSSQCPIDSYVRLASKTLVSLLVDLTALLLCAFNFAYLLAHQ